MRDTSSDKVEPDTITVVGHARLPQSLSPVDAAVILVELEVQRQDGLIVNLHISGALPGAARLLAGLLVGKTIDKDFGTALHDFQRRYVGPPQKAIATALSSAQESYQRYLRQSGLGTYFSRHARPPDEGLR